MIKYNAKIKYQKIINRVKMKLYNMMFLTIDPMVYIYRYIGLNKTFYSNKEFCLDHHSRTYILQYKKKRHDQIYIIINTTTLQSKSSKPVEILGDIPLYHHLRQLLPSPRFVSGNVIVPQ